MVKKKYGQERSLFWTLLVSAIILITISTSMLIEASSTFGLSIHGISAFAIYSLVNLLMLLVPGLIYWGIESAYPAIVDMLFYKIFVVMLFFSWLFFLASLPFEFNEIVKLICNWDEGCIIVEPVWRPDY